MGECKPLVGGGGGHDGGGGGGSHSGGTAEGIINGLMNGTLDSHVSRNGNGDVNGAVSVSNLTRSTPHPQRASIAPADLEAGASTRPPSTLNHKPQPEPFLSLTSPETTQRVPQKVVT